MTEVSVHRLIKNILGKLGAKDRTQAVTIALKHGIIALQLGKRRQVPESLSF